MRDRDDVPRLATLGERLTAAGEALADRHVPVYPWAAGLAPVLDRAALLSASWAQRFERHEAGERPWAAAGRPGRSAGEPVAGTASPGRPMPGPGATTPAGRTLPVDVRARLATMAGPGAAVMRVLTGLEADTTVRGQRADAVTVGTDVRVRSGLLLPDTAEGFALLAHEASHVTAALRRGGAAQHAVPGAAAAEEHEALEVERATLRAFGGPDSGPGRTGGAPARTPSFVVPAMSRGGPSGARTGAAAGPGGGTTANGAAALAVPAGAGPPMRADTDRAQAAASPSFDVEALRRDLVEELMRRVRNEFERGG